MNCETNKTSEYAIEIKNLSVEYHVNKRVVKAVNGLYLAVEKGKTLGLVGETGAGKTTTGLAIMQLITTPPGIITEGSICLDGKELLGERENNLVKIRGQEVSMIFQDPMTSLNPVMTIEEQIAEAILAHGDNSRATATKKAQEMLELVGIPGSRGKEYPHQFSGGMRQRAVIAIALACNPRLLIADEPTTALDVTIQAQVLEKMKELKNQYGMSMLMITHDLGIVAEVCDTVSVMYAGKVVEHGTLEDVYEHTLHPYTKGLFNSLPNMEDRTVELKPIKGMMPDPSNLPTGCPFHPRCDYATDQCSATPPCKVQRNDTHYVLCHLYNESNILKEGILK